MGNNYSLMLGDRGAASTAVRPELFNAAASTPSLSICRRLAGVVTLLLLVVMGGASWWAAWRFLETIPPEIPGVDLYERFSELEPLSITVRAGWDPMPTSVRVQDLMSDPTLWGRMLFQDWDKVPEGYRERALDAMLVRYDGALAGPRMWASMTTDDWDRVPQPVRAMAFIGMAHYWATDMRWHSPTICRQSVWQIL